MAIFASLELESVAQVGDKIRIDAGKSFTSPDEAAISLIEIKPESSASWYDVTSNKYLDWQYSTGGTKTVSVRITTDAAPEVASLDIEALTAVDDKLFSGDQDIVPYEDDILKYVRSGRNSFLDKHRAAQKRILAILDEKRITAQDGSKLTKEHIFDKEEFKDWSKFMVLQMIFESLSNAVDDVFDRKAKKYASLCEMASNRAVLRIDLNKDGELTSNENLEGFSYSLLKR